MSSLRLALKQSLEESGATLGGSDSSSGTDSDESSVDRSRTASPKRDDHHHHHHLNTSGHSHHSHSSHQPPPPVVKVKRGPGRPRKHPLPQQTAAAAGAASTPGAANQNPPVKRKRGRPPKKQRVIMTPQPPPSHDQHQQQQQQQHHEEDDFSSENEFSHEEEEEEEDHHSDEEEEDSKHDDDHDDDEEEEGEEHDSSTRSRSKHNHRRKHQRSSAASKIQSHWKKKKNGPSTSTTSDHPTAAASVAAGTSSTAHSSSSRKQPTPEPASASVERRDHEPAASTSHPSSATTAEPSNRKSPPPHQSAATSSTTAETEAASKPPQQQQEDANNNENKAAPEKPKNKKTKTVPPPVPEVLEWTRNLPVKRARKFMTQGLRVKVRFSTKVKREGKIVRKKKWFGGRVSAVSKKGSKIRIKYDDGTTEETKFPDKDVVVDDTSNGQHGSAVVANAEKFIPPSALKESRHGHDATAADGHVVADERKQPAILQHGAKQQQHGKEEHAASKREHQHAGHAPPTMSSEHVKPQAMEIDKGSSSTAPAAAAAAAASDPTAPHDVNTPMKPVKRKRGRPPKHRPPVQPVQPPVEGNAAAESAPGDAHVKKHADHGTATAAGGHHKRHVSAGSHEQQQQQQEAMDIQSDRAAGLFLSAGDADTNQQEHHQQQSGLANEQQQEQRESLADAFAVAEPGAADDGINSNKNAAEAVPASPSSKKATLKIRLSKSNINAERSQSTENAMQVDQQQQQQAPEQQSPARASVSLKGFADAAAPSQEMDVVTEKAPENKPIVARHKKRPSSSMSATGAATNDGEPPLKRLHIHISKSSKKEPASSEQQDQRKTATPPIEEGQVNSDKNTGDAGDEPSKPMPMLAKQPQAATETQSHSSPNTARKIKRKRMEAAAAAGEAIPALPITTRVVKGTAEDQQAALAGFAAASASQMGDDKEAGSLVGSKNSAFDKKDGLSIKAPPTEDSQQLAEGSKATLTPRGGRGKKDFSVEAVPVRSGRRAAQEANERITNKPEPSDKDQAGKKKKKRAHRHEGGEGEAGADPEGGEFQWVQCDGCAKWRIIPSIVVDSLPSEWFCADNKWDPKRATCEAPEQTAKQIAKEKKRKKRQRLLMEKAAAESAAAGEMQGVKPEAASMDRERPKSPKPTQEATVATEETQMPSSATTSSRPTRRPSPAESLHSEPGAVSDLKKPEKKSAPPAKRARGNAATAAATESVAAAPEEPPPPPLPPAEPKRGRGRPRRNPIKESGPAPTTPGGKDGDDGDNLEWVQCEKCDKWRKLPPHISADELPDIWYCQMNTWNPSSASCEVPEDKAEGLQDIFSNGGSGAAKLSYRNLIFGSNGRRAGRPISERTRAAESLFATVSDDNEAPPTVMYANSGAFICRSKAHQQEENTGPSVLDIMSNSHLWKELNGAAQPDGKRMPFYSFDMLPNKLQESMKDLALNSLATQTLTGEEVHAEIQARNWDNVPQGWTAVREYCSVNVLVVALCQLVKEGVLECVQKKHLTLSADVGGQDWDLAYRRAKMYSQAILPAAEKSGDGGPADLAADDSSRSRCMKFRKPWKK